MEKEVLLALWPFSTPNGGSFVFLLKMASLWSRRPPVLMEKWVVSMGTNNRKRKGCKGRGS